jgi:hypothetical protein
MLIWTAWAGEKVAVLDFQSLLASEDYGIAVAEILRTELVGLGDYTIIERGMLQQIIEEQSLQLSGAIDSETAVEIGKLTGQINCHVLLKYILIMFVLNIHFPRHLRSHFKFLLRLREKPQ